MAGKYPAILSDDIVGSEASKLYDDAQQMLDKIIEEQWITAQAIVGIFPVKKEGDDLLLQHGDETTRLCFLRQQNEKAAGRPNYCLSDFVHNEDYIGLFAVTAGQGIEPYVKSYEEDHDDYHAIMLKAVADRLAEATAEYMHEVVRKEIWGYDQNEALANDDLIAEQYKGIRPAPGYPACPDHTEKLKIWDILQVKETIGISLTESMAMYPAASVSGYYFGSNDSQYFGLGKIAKDQVTNYAHRKGWTIREAEKWLEPNLSYEID